MIYPITCNHKGAEKAILISDKIAVKTRNTIRNKNKHFKILTVALQESVALQEDKIIINIRPPNSRALKHMK